MIVGRYAPSPTGDLHIGNAFAALVAWARAHHAGGRCLLRIEDLDTPRVVAGAATRIREDCAALGLAFDPFEPGKRVERVVSAERVAASDADADAVADGVVWQSRRTHAYRQALQTLIDDDLLFACRCSRKDLQRAASAPHPGEDGPVYPGTCRDAGLPLDAPDVALRVRIDRLVARFGDRGAGNVVVVDDAWQGRFAQDVVGDVGDIVVRRRDGLFSYQLAVVVDDRWQGITEIVRGADLLSSAPRQVLLHRALAAIEGAVCRPPSFAHLPLLVDDTGTRLSKRSAQAPDLLRGVMQRVTAPRLVGHLAVLLGLVEPGPGASLEPAAFAALPFAHALRRASVRWLPPT
jgi:glutamyl/glutaminyl-tRNA synthetase